MDCGSREMTVKEEIELLNIPQEVKDRILNKLIREFSEKIEKERAYNERLEIDMVKIDIDRIIEQNLALKNACFALSDALKQETTIK